MKSHFDVYEIKFITLSQQNINHVFTVLYSYMAIS